MSQLHRRAEDAGVHYGYMCRADEALNPKEAYVELVVKAETQPTADQTAEARRRQGGDAADGAADGERVQREAALREELATLRVSELRRRAAAAGVGEDEIDGADDALNPKQALIALVAKAEGAV